MSLLSRVAALALVIMVLTIGALTSTATAEVLRDREICRRVVEREFVTPDGGRYGSQVVEEHPCLAISHDPSPPGLLERIAQVVGLLGVLIAAVTGAVGVVGKVLGWRRSRWARRCDAAVPRSRESGGGYL